MIIVLSIAAIIFLLATCVILREAVLVFKSATASNLGKVKTYITDANGLTFEKPSVAGSSR